MHISEINIFPIKSLKGIAVSSAAIESWGLRLDRRWVLTDADGTFLTQREMPAMATIRIGFRGDGIQASVEHGTSLDIDPLTEGERTSVQVWQSSSVAIGYDADVNEWFSDVLKAHVRLFYMPDDGGRPVNMRFNRGSEVVSFADGYPLMALGEASLAELNSRLDTPLPMNRFRPNLVISGSDAFAEDDWLKIKVGEATFRSTKPCERCVITTVDQDRGEFDGKDPLQTLATYRQAKMVMPERFEALGVSGNGVLFGQNLIAETPGAIIRLGDEVSVVEMD
jgi:uncharacterized protein YcbX